MLVRQYLERFPVDATLASSVSVDELDVAGVVSLRSAGSLLILDFDLVAKDHIEVEADYSDPSLWFNGFAQLESEGTTISAETGRVRLGMNGKRRYAVYLHNRGGRETTVNLRFLADGRFLWTSERDGWRHLYLYASDGSSATRLTSGQWQIESIDGVDAGEQTVFFQANRGDRRQRHLFRIDLNSGEISQLDAEPRGVHSGTPSPSGSLVVDSWSSLDTPPRVDVLFANGTPPRRLWESGGELASWDLLEFERGTVTADDGTELDATVEFV